MFTFLKFAGLLALAMLAPQALIGYWATQDDDEEDEDLDDCGE